MVDNAAWVENLKCVYVLSQEIFLSEIRRNSGWKEPGSRFRTASLGNSECGFSLPYDSTCWKGNCQAPERFKPFYSITPPSRHLLRCVNRGVLSTAILQSKDSRSRPNSHILVCRYHSILFASSLRGTGTSIAPAKLPPLQHEAADDDVLYWVGTSCWRSQGFRISRYLTPPFMCMLARTPLICQQGCVSKCWDNSKYVSSCVKANETQCLCEDAEFQSVRTATSYLTCIANEFKVVLQCLYSQCQTSQFGSALHQTLSACSDSAVDTLDALPPLIRHPGLRKRGSPSNGYVSGQLSASAIHSVARRSVSASAYVSTRPTRSVGHFPTVTHEFPKSL